MDGDRNSEETNPIPASPPSADPYLDVVRASTEAVVRMSECLRALEKSVDDSSVEYRKALDDVRIELRLLGSSVDAYAQARDREALAEERVATVEEERIKIERDTASAADSARSRRWEAAVSFVKTIFSNPYATLPLGALFLGIAQVIASYFGIDVMGLIENVPE